MTIAESPTNAWRQETPGAASWSRTIRADDPNKLFVIGHSAGAYLAALLVLDPKYLSVHGLTPKDIRRH